MKFNYEKADRTKKAFINEINKKKNTRANTHT